jgi:hypothetical protein
MRTVVLVAAAAAGVFSGCGSDSMPPLHHVALDVRVSWSFRPKSVDEVGFVYTITLYQPTGAGSGPPCDNLPASLQVTGLGQTLPLTLNAVDCLYTSVITPPTLQPSPVVFTANLDGTMVGQATFDGLTPGAAASLVSPADGVVRVGDEVVISPPPSLPSNTLSLGDVFPLEEVPWPGPQTISSEEVRLADGIHIKMPAFTGRAAVAFEGSPFLPDPTVNCDGFAVCTATPSDVLGPVFVTGGI